MRKFSSKRLYNLVKYSVIVIAVLFISIGIYKTIEADNGPTRQELIEECEQVRANLDRTPIKIVTTCVQVADREIKVNRDEANTAVVVGVIPITVFFAIRGIYVFLFPKKKE